VLILLKSTKYTGGRDWLPVALSATVKLNVHISRATVGGAINTNSNDKDYTHAITTNESLVQANQAQDSSSRKNKSFKEYFREYAEKTQASELYLSRKWWIHGIKYALREKFTKQH